MKKKNQTVMSCDDVIDAQTAADIKAGRKCRVYLYAQPAQPQQQLYICGDIPSAGEWNAAIAKPMKLTDKGWRAIKVLPVGSAFSFKILRDRTWAAVEKGTWREEIDNHVIVAQKGLVVTMPIPTFANE